MSKPEQANEPTMEEILASIRRIISDDDQESGAAAAEAEGEREASQMPAAASAMAMDREPEAEAGYDDESPAMDAMAGDDFAAAGDSDGEDDLDVLELTEEISAEQEPQLAEMAAGAPALRDEDEGEDEGGESDIVFLEKTEEEMDAEFDAEIDRMKDLDGDDEPAPAAAARRVEERGLLSSNADSSVASAFSSLENFVLSTHSRTLEDLVQDMLRPMLKDWLDANLPPLVERLVREEIERVSRGRR